MLHHTSYKHINHEMYSCTFFTFTGQHSALADATGLRCSCPTILLLMPPLCQRNSLIAFFDAALLLIWNQPKGSSKRYQNCLSDGQLALEIPSSNTVLTLELRQLCPIISVAFRNQHSHTLLSKVVLYEPLIFYHKPALRPMLSISLWLSPTPVTSASLCFTTGIPLCV